MTIKEKILSFLTEKGIKKTEFFEKTHIASSNFKGAAINSELGGDKIAKILTLYPELSADWLLTGIGPMLKTKSQQTCDQQLSVPDYNDKVTKINTNNKEKRSKNNVIPLTESHDKLLDVSNIPLYNIDVSAGLNKLFADGGELIGQISIPNAPKCDGAVHVIGDSMYPLLKSGDIIAYRIVRDILSVNFGEIYILQLDNCGDISIVVKYVKRSDIDDDHIKLVSYNKEHDPKDIPLAWIQAIARVTFAIRRFSII
jgi:phage repressor protein C with HTH and peptisase S24 domain